MKMLMISSTVAIVLAIGAYCVLVQTGMDSASVYSSANVRL